jgi:DNA-binding FadR family transcriptional regulator
MISTPPLRGTAIHDVLEREITMGLHLPGERLPSEADLCARFAVSRPTLREALGRLSARGLIQTRRGAQGGTFVVRPSLSDALAQLGPALALAQIDPATLRAAMAQLQGACLRLVCAESGRDLHDMRAEIDVQSDFAITDAAFIASCTRMHLALCALSGNSVLTAMTGALIAAVQATQHGADLPVRLRARYLSFHVRLANAVGAGLIEPALAALEDLHAFEVARLSEEPAPPPPPRPLPRRGLRLPPIQRPDALAEGE